MSFESICAAAREHPAKTAVVYNGTAISYAAFAGAIADISRYIETQELSAGNTVVVIIHNLLDCWVTVLALQALGLNTVCVASTPILEALRLNNVAGIVTTEPETHKHQLESDARMGNRVITIPNLVYSDEKLPAAPACRRNAENGGHILYTSGTTGNYKKLFLSGDLQHERDAERIGNPPYGTHTTYHCGNFGLWTGAGYKIPRTIWLVAGCVIFDQRPDWPQYFLQSGMTQAVLIPDLVNHFTKVLDEQSLPAQPMDFDLSVSGGFVSRDLADKLINRVTKNLINVYGSTEINLAILESKITTLDDLHWISAAGYRTVEIVDEAGNICPVGVEGQLRVRLSELDCSSYLDDPQASEKVFRAGYFYPGDMAVRRGDGRIRILGRSADVLNFRGQKLAAAPIEHEIQNRLGVDNVCLFSGINIAGEDEVVIAIESEHWPEQSDLNNLGHGFAQFDQVRFALVYPFPRTRTGFTKIDRNALRKLVFPAH
jgi:acyl-coenzyme A synthetase/AMP-(fatty) acid ligase